MSFDKLRITTANLTQFETVKTITCLKCPIIIEKMARLAKYQKVKNVHIVAFNNEISSEADPLSKKVNSI